MFPWSRSTKSTELSPLQDEGEPIAVPTRLINGGDTFMSETTSLDHQQFFEKMHGLPGYRLAYDLAVELCGPVDDWDNSDSRSVDEPVDKQLATSAGATRSLLHLSGPYDSSKLLADFGHKNGYDLQNPAERNHAIKDVMALVAPRGQTGLLQELSKELPDDIRTSDAIREMLHAASTVKYLQSLTLLHLFGPKGAGEHLPADRGEYPVWYGHFNQIVREASSTLATCAPPHVTYGAQLLLNNSLIKSPFAWSGTHEDRSYRSSSRGETAEVYIAQIPWHPRHAEACRALQWSRHSFSY